MKSNSSEGSGPTAPKRLLDGIRSPADIKALREQDLPQLAQEVRDELIEVLWQRGGHLGPNLGVVELTVALHRVFNTPRDRFVMDVIHQACVLKIFIGRLDSVSTMRQYCGVNGLLVWVDKSVKGLIVASVIFEELGLRYYGPIDGHDIPLLIRTFEFLKTQDEPVLLHILTKKGKGYEPAIKQPDKFHGLGKYKLETGETAPTPTPTYSEIIGKTLAKFAEHNQKIVAITAAMPTGTGLSHFQKAHPTRYFDVGIAEEHAALFACGIATQGLTPFLTIYSTFFQRAYDMAIHDMAIQKLNVRLCMDRAGLSGDDGPTHHGLFDIGYLRHIPNWVHMQPKNEDEFVDMLWTMAHYNAGTIAVRYPRGPGTGAQIKAEPKLLEIGKAEVVQHGRDVAIFGLGNMFEVAEEAARKLEEKGVSVALINPRWIKPLDTGTLEFFARGVEVVCTIEDHVLHNGFGCAVMEHLHSQMINTPVVRIGWPDQFIEHGAVPILRKKHGITADALVETVLPLLRKKPAAKSSAA